MIAFPPCPECDDGLVADDNRDHGFERVAGHLLGEYGPICRICGTDHKLPCPSCGGRGVLITDELVEAATETYWRQGFGLFGSRTQHIESEKFRGVLVAVVEKLKENQQ